MILNWWLVSCCMSQLNWVLLWFDCTFDIFVICLFMIGCVWQMLCTIASTSDQLPQEEVWTYKQHPSKEEVKVDSIQMDSIVKKLSLHVYSLCRKRWMSEILLDLMLLNFPLTCRLQNAVLMNVLINHMLHLSFSW